MRCAGLAALAAVAALLGGAAGCSSNGAVGGADASAGLVAEGGSGDAGNLPFLGAGGIGVSDLARSLDFYTRVIGMTLRYNLPVPNFVNEDVLYFKETPDSPYSDVVIGTYDDGVTYNYANNPDKLVFHVPSATAMVERIRAEGLAVVSEPAADPASGGAVVARAKDPDGYVLELIEDPAIAVPFLSAAGIGVSDLDRSTAFYTGTLGMQTRGDRVSVPGLWDEVTLHYPSARGSAVTLLHVTDGSNPAYASLPCKLVSFVPDSRVTAARVEDAGLRLLSPPMILDVMGTQARIALGTDPDGYIMELVTVVSTDAGAADAGSDPGANR